MSKTFKDFLAENDEFEVDGHTLTYDGEINPKVKDVRSDNFHIFVEDIDGDNGSHVMEIVIEYDNGESYINIDYHLGRVNLKDGHFNQGGRDEPSGFEDYEFEWVESNGDSKISSKYMGSNNKRINLQMVKVANGIMKELSNVKKYNPNSPSFSKQVHELFQQALKVLEQSEQ